SGHSQLSAKARERQDNCLAGLKMSLAKMNLVKHRNRRALREVSSGWADALFTGLALDREQRSLVLYHHKVDFTSIRIAQEAQLHAVAFDILSIMAVFEKLRGDEIFEALARPAHGRPVPKI